MDPARKFAVLSVAAACALGGLLVWTARGDRTEVGQGTLLLHCAAGIKPPVEAVAQEYERAYGITVLLQYGGSGTLLSALRVTSVGDLYLAADRSYMDEARRYGLLDETLPLARIRPVIAVAPGNPKRIQGIADLLRPQVRTALGNPDAASIGRQTRKLLSPSGDWSKLKDAVQTRGVFKPTVNDLANDVKLGTVDAAIVWDATAKQFHLDLVRVPAFERSAQQVTVGVLKSSRQPAIALRFMRYLGARDQGLRAFAKEGFEPVDGDAWAETPELTVFSGAMLRPAVEQTIKAFEAREGVRVTRVYNGCGILVAQMKTGARPDAYFSCDVSFMDQVRDLYLKPQVVSANDMVILVKKGNPRGIHTLQDLTRPGLKVGLGHPKQSALGTLTRKVLKRAGIYEAIRRNVAVESPTGDFLVVQTRTGSLDAAVVYASNAAGAGADTEIVRIDQAGALAEQPIAVAKDTRHKYLAQRLLRAVLDEGVSKDRFEQNGFHWRGGAATASGADGP